MSPQAKREMLRRLLIAERARTSRPSDAGEMSPALVIHRPEARFEPFPLNETQQAYWIGRSNGLVLGGVSAHVYYEFESSVLDLPRLERSWRRLIERHDMLRAIILPDGTQQVLAEVPAYVIPVTDLTGEPPSAVAAALDHARSRMSHEIRPAGQWPLFQLAATRLPGGVTRLHIGVDILIADAWSVQLLMAEWRLLYENPEAWLEPLRITFRDYACAAVAYEQGPEFHRALEHWRKRIITLPPPPKLPLRPDVGDRPVRFERRSARLPRREWKALKTRAEAEGLTPSGLLLAAFAEVLATWSEHPQFAISLTLFHRYPIHAQVNSIVGDFTSLSLLGVDATVGATFNARARRIQETLWDDFEHRSVNAVRILRELARGGRRSPGITMAIVFTSTLNKHWETEHAPSDWLGQMVYSITQTPQVLLDHQVYEVDGELSWNWDAVDDFFAPGVLDSMFAAYSDLVWRLAKDPATWAHDSPVKLPAAEVRAREVANATAVSVRETTISGLFLQAAHAWPGRLAVISGGRQLSYSELLSRSCQYARALHEHGVQRGQRVAVVMQKGWEQVVATLSVCLAGGAYLPIEPELPRDRRFHLMRHANACWALTQPALRHRIEWPEEVTPLIVTDEVSARSADAPADHATPDDIAYVIYTSGSTGTPKGVMIRHAAAVNTIWDLNRRLGIDERDRVLALSSLSFDLSVYDIFGLLAVGGTVIIPAPEEAHAPASWERLIRDHGVTLWNSVPALMKIWITHLTDAGSAVPPSLRMVLLSGDWIPVELPMQIRERGSRAQILSLGGATEAAIWSIAYPIAAVDPKWPSIPYGKPLGNQRVYVLDHRLSPRPVGVAGELYIAGRGLADAYLGDEAQTAAAFIRHPQTDERLYRTGDLGRYLPSGDIEFLGREDTQVKIHGHRIELGEVEGTLCQHPAIRQAAAVVNALDNGAKRLVAYVVLDPHAAGDLMKKHSVPDSAVQSRFQKARAAGEEALTRLSDDTGALQGTLSGHLDHITTAATARALVSLGAFTRIDETHSIADVVTRARILPRYADWLARGLAFLVADKFLALEGDHLRSEQSLFDLAESAGSAINDLPRLLDRMEGVQPERFGPAVDFITRVAAALPAILTGREDPGAILFGEGSSAAEALYGSAFAQCNGVLMAICTALASELSQVRAVEIGAGVGSSTAYILPVLPADRSSYLYTDVSPYFLEVGQRRFGTLPHVRFGLCDIERDPNLQGLAPHSFDLVIACSVLHATRDISETLTHLSALLAPGGTVVLIEETRFHRAFNLTMGLQQGFDRFADRCLRRKHPLLAISEWRAALAAAGMSPVVDFTAEASSAAFWGLTVLMAGGPVTVTQLDEEALLAYARTKLPGYMVPARIARLASLPLSANGKLDRRMLSEARHSIGGRGTASLPPRTSAELKLAKIWVETLRVERVGRHDNFFELGGDSLVATQLASIVRMHFNVEIPLRTIFEQPTLAAMAAIIDGSSAKPECRGWDRDVCRPANIVTSTTERYEPFPLTEVQQAYWLGRRGGFELGNISCRLYVEIDTEQLDLEQFEAALQRLIQRHEMLRAVMLADARQQILEVVSPFRVEVIDLSRLDAAAAETVLNHTRDELSHAICDPGIWPLFDVRATRLAAGRMRLHLGFDLLIGDAWSFLLLARELSTLLERPDADLPPLGINFRDYVLFEQSLKETPAYQEALAYWRRRIPSLPAAPELPLAQRPETLERPRFSRRAATLSAPEWQALKARATACGLTPSGVLLAAFAEVLALWSRTPRFTLNLTLFQRPAVHPDIERIVGDFTSLMLVEVDPGDELTFEGRARRLQAQLWDDLDHRIVSGVRVMRELARAERSVGPVGMPVVFTSTLTLGPLYDGALGLSRIGKVAYAITQTPQVWLDHQVMEENSALLYQWDAIEALFPDGMLDAMFDSYRRFLVELAGDGGRWRELRRPAVPETELAVRRRIDHKADQRPGHRLEEPFFQHARQDPGHPAVIARDCVLTYGELAAKASALGARLNQLGVGPGSIVPVVTEKGCEHVVAVVGVLTSGAAYMPLDPTSPPVCADELFRDAAATVAITDTTGDCIAWLDGLQRVHTGEFDVTSHMDLPCSHAHSGTDVACVIYAFRPTGVPNGVAIDHRSICNTIDDINERFAVSPDDRILAVSSLGSDLSVYDLWGTLAAGGTIVMPDAALAREPAHWEDLTRRQSVTLWNSTPALFELLIRQCEETNAGVAPSLRLAMLSVDRIPSSLPARARRFAPGLDIVSLAGATETSIWSVVCPFDRADHTCNNVPHWRPLRNQHCYVLDRWFEPRPVWVVGDLYIAGYGLALGYIGNAEKTAEAFVHHPRTGERLYRTGDIARYLPDGTVELLGRADAQVKVHGHRVELRDVKAVIEQHPEVRTAEVVMAVNPEGLNRLIAYVVPTVPLAARDDAMSPVMVDGEDGPEDPGRTMPQIALADPLGDDGRALAFRRRRSQREFSDRPVTLQTIGALLSNLRTLEIDGLTKRAYPSAGHIYPVHVLLYCKPDRVEKLAAGVYQYDAHDHRLLLISPDVRFAAEDQVAINQAIFEASAFLLFLVADVGVAAERYGPLARDFCLLEAGAMLQLLMTAAPGEFVGMCPVGSLVADDLTARLRLAPGQQILHTLIAGPVSGDRSKAWSFVNPPLRTRRQFVRSVRRYVRRRLPSYMVPSIIEALEAIPLGPDGKVIRDALTARPALHGAKPYVAPRTSTEEEVASIWQTVLQVERVSVDENFFDLGGDSLIAIQLLSRMRERFGFDVSFRVLLEGSTVADVARMVDHRGTPRFSKMDTQPFADRSQIPVAVRRESRSLDRLIETGEVAPIDSAALFAIPSTVPVGSHVIRDAIRDALVRTGPRLCGLLTTQWGRVGLFFLPLLDEDVYASASSVSRRVAEASTRAARLGARAVSLTGLIPSALTMHDGWRELGTEHEVPLMTSGHATTAAAIVLGIHQLLSVSGRALRNESVAFVGLGSIGRSVARIIASQAEAPAQITLCDVYGSPTPLDRLRQELVAELRYTGDVVITLAKRGETPAVGEATLIVGATNVPNVIDIGSLAPGTMLIDDSVPHCFETSQAIARWENDGDLLFTEGGSLRLAEPIDRVVSVPEEFERLIPPDMIAPWLRAWLGISPTAIMGCTFSGLLSGRAAKLPATGAVVTQEAVHAHLETLAKLGIRAGDIACEDYLLDPSSITQFKERFSKTGF
jgi:yersiniabactin nonribosomal peptide synthetase